MPSSTPSDFPNRSMLKTAIIGGILFLLVIICFSGCATYVPPGSVGIVVHNASGVVDPDPIGAGWHGRWPFFTTIDVYPTYMQTFVLAKSLHEGGTDNNGGPENEEINVNSFEGQPVSMDVSVSFEVDSAKATHMYLSFRKPISDIEYGYMRQSIRQAFQEVVGSEKIGDIIGPKKAEIIGRTQTLLSERLAPYGFNIKQLTQNELRPPKAVIDAVNMKNVMQQEALTAQNKLQKQQFEASGDSIKAAGEAKAITGLAEAQAGANERLAKSVTPVLVQYMLAQKWDGALPQYSGGTPLIQLPVQAGK